MGKVRLPYKMGAFGKGVKIQGWISHRKGKFTIQVYMERVVGRILV